MSAARRGAETWTWRPSGKTKCCVFLSLPCIIGLQPNILRRWGSSLSVALARIFLFCIGWLGLFLQSLLQLIRRLFDEHTNMSMNDRFVFNVHTKHMFTTAYDQFVFNSMIPSNEGANGVWGTSEDVHGTPSNKCIYQNKHLSQTTCSRLDVGLLGTQYCFLGILSTCYLYRTRWVDRGREGPTGTHFPA